MFIIPINVIASHTQTTPERVDAIVFCSPCVLPPAAKKQAHATMPAGTARLAIAPTLTHRAISTPMLTASAISMSIRSNLLYRGRRSEEHTSELQSQSNLVCRLLLEKKK